MKDPLGSDPLGIAPVTIVQQATNMATSRALSAYKDNIQVRGLYRIDRENPAPVGPALNQDGQAMTLEARQAIAAGRKPYDPDTFGTYGRKFETLPDGRTISVDLGYAADGAGPALEPLGASAEKIIQAQPEMQIVRPINLDLPRKHNEPTP